MIKVGIVGGTGYTGVELLRLLAGHPEVEIQRITSRSETGKRVSELFPNLRGYVDIEFTHPQEGQFTDCDLVFFATPNAVAMEATPKLLKQGVRVIDLAADFRLKDASVWKQWYGVDHACPELLSEAVYGLPEINREHIKQAQLVANPGCYPTAVQLALLPLIDNGLVDTQHIIADCKSGVSGAGRKASVGTAFCETTESISAYSVAGHRHLPEIKQGLDAYSSQSLNLVFVPHLTPMVRGILATVYCQLLDVSYDVQALFQQRYANEAFVDVLPPGSHPDTRSVKGSNTCRIALHQPQSGSTLVVLSVIDNLIKGAAGQAVQNMNIMFGLDETAGIQHIALLP